MQVIVGTETGLLKSVDTKTKKTEDFGKQNFARSIVQLEADLADNEKFLYLTKGGEIHSADKSFSSDECIVKGLSQPIGFHLCDSHIFTASKRGKIQIFDHLAGSSVSSFETNGATDCLHVNEDLVAIGGKERPLEVWDWKNKKRSWQADFPPPTKRLKLPQKLWVKKCSFLSGTSKIVSVTAQGRFQVHDTKESKKPIVDVKLSETALQCLYIDQSNQKYAYVGSVSGEILKVRISDGRVFKTLKGGIGSIRSLFVDSDGMLFCVGTGKYLRTHDLNKRFKTVTQEIYLKQRLTSLLIFPDSSKSPEDADGIWNDLDAGAVESPENVGEKRSLGSEESPNKKQKLEE